MDSQFHHIGIVIRPQTSYIRESVEEVVQFLLANQIEVYLDCDAEADLSAMSAFAQCQLINKKKMGKKCDLVISFGGDGTLLSIARKIAPYRVPLIGVNRGSLGFLTQVGYEQCLAEIQLMLSGKYIPEERILLEATIIRENEEIHRSLALNDVVFSRGGMGQMIEFEVFINKEFVYTQRSDGLIVSTPTGSTAYALAAGGPILQPTLRAVSLVPICPQSMNNRPIAVNDASEIEVLITKGWDARLYFDGQSHFDLKTMDKIAIHRYRSSLRMLHPSDYRYFKTLRQKLHWGEQLV